MRKNKSSLNYDPALQKLPSSADMLDLVRETQLAAFEEGKKIGAILNNAEIRKMVARWLTLNDAQLRIMAQEFIKS